MSSDLAKDQVLLSVRGLSVVLPHDDGCAGSGETPLILDGISFEVNKCEALGITGQSGSGKSTLLRSILGMVDSSYIRSGSIRYDGVNIMVDGNVDRRAVARVRGSSMSFVWQNPNEMLHPMYRAARQITEHLRIHEKLNKSEATERAIEALHKAGVAAPADLLHKFPHELSGGEAQRVCLAQALVTRPKLLVADEVLSSLDPATTTDIMAFLAELVHEGLSLLFVSHDLDALTELCGSTAVFYEGKKVEHRATRQLLSHPSHQHTQSLVQADRQLQGLT